MVDLRHRIRPALFALNVEIENLGKNHASVESWGDLSCFGQFIILYKTLLAHFPTELPAEILPSREKDEEHLDHHGAEDRQHHDQTQQRNPPLP